LIPYIHLNPLRAGVVTAFEELDGYRYSGDSILMGRGKSYWQDINTVLSFFGQKVSSARKQYHVLVQKAIALGKRPELTGGGLVRSSGGWRELKSLRKSGIHLKGDERILGDSDFVESVLERRYRFQVQGYNFDEVVSRVAGLFEMKPGGILRSGRQPERVRARSLVCYWAVKELGMNGSTVAKLLGIIQSSVSRAVQRGEKLALEKQYSLEEQRTHKIMAVPFLLSTTTESTNFVWE